MRKTHQGQISIPMRCRVTENEDIAVTGGVAPMPVNADEEALLASWLHGRSSYSASSSHPRMTGIRSWTDATTAFGAVVTMVQFAIPPM